MAKNKKFFNRHSFRAPSKVSQIPQKDLQERVMTLLETLKGLEVEQDIKYSKVSYDNTLPITQKLTNAQHPGTVHYRGIAKNHIIEVADVAPHYMGWSRDVGDLYSIERLVMICDKSKGAGEKGDIFIRLSPFHASVNIITGPGFSNADFINDGSPEAKQAVNALTAVLKQINNYLPVPKWVKSFDRKFDMKNNTITLKIKKS